MKVEKAQTITKTSKSPKNLKRLTVAQRYELAYHSILPSLSVERQKLIKDGKDDREFYRQVVSLAESETPIFVST